MKKVKERKMLLVLPLLVIPFLTMAFWALGGRQKKPESSVTLRGLNLDLPDANLKDDKGMDKLGFYDKADKDSLKMEEWMRSDPYFKKDTVPEPLVPDELQELTTATASKYNQQLNTSPYEKRGNNPEEKIMQKLKLLEKEMNAATAATHQNPIEQQSSSSQEFSSEVDRLEQMLKVNNTGTTEDPEMKQLEGTLDKILDIQHPQRVKDRIKEYSLLNKEAVYAVSKRSGSDTIVKGFYSLSDETEVVDQNAIEAVVHESQVLVNGAVVKFRLSSAIYINGSLIPKDNFVFGIASLNNERLEIEINSIRCNNNLYPVKLEVYDMDGLPGIYIPGAISRDVAKQSADNSLSLMEMSSGDPSLKAQATVAGIGAAKSLLSKKVKLVKVLVKAGYKVLLKDKNINQ